MYTAQLRIKVVISPLVLRRKSSINLNMKGEKENEIESQVNLAESVTAVA